MGIAHYIQKTTDVLNYILMGVGKLTRGNNLLLGVCFIPGTILGIWQTSFYLISKAPLRSGRGKCYYDY